MLLIGVPAGALEVAALEDGSVNMAEVLRSNEGLRKELARSQKKISEMRDLLEDQAAKIKELQSGPDMEEVSDPDSGWIASWFAYFFLPKDVAEDAQSTTAVDPGCKSVACCLTLISDWVVGICKFLASGIWSFFWDPVTWWHGTRGSILDVIQKQMQVLSRALGLVLLVFYLNVIAWIIRRIRRIGAWIRRLGIWVWNLPLVSLMVDVITWGIVRLGTGIPRQEKNQMEQLLRKVDDLAKVVQRMQSAPVSPAVTPPQRPVPAVPAAADGRLSRPCPNCGKKGHLLTRCPSPKQCLRCRSTRHLARDCPNVRSVVIEAPRPGYRRVTPQVEEISASPGEGDLVRQVEDLRREVETTVNVAEGSRASVLNVLAGLGSAKGKILVDTGSSVNVMPRSFAEEQGLELSTDTEESGMKLRAFNGTVSDVMGTVVLPVTVGRWKATIPFVVTDSCSAVILGMPGLTDLNVKVDPARRCLEDRAGHLVFCQTVDVSAPAYSLELQKN